MGKIIAIACAGYIIITCVYGSITHWIYNSGNKRKRHE